MRRWRFDDGGGGCSPGDYFQFFFRPVSVQFRRLQWRRFIQTRCVMSASLLEELR
jgi:hypothetical protein